MLNSALAHDAKPCRMESWRLVWNPYGGVVGKRAIKRHGGALVFKLLSQGEALAWVVGFQLMFAVFLAWDPEILHNPVGRLFVGFFFAGTLVMVLLALLQRVIIDGSFVQILNAASGFRWRRFDASEVETVRFVPASYEVHVHSFVVSLKPSAERRWRQVRLTSMDTAGYRGGVEAPVFLAFMRAVALSQPTLTVENLPVHYRGVLAPPLPTIAAPRPPPGRGKTRKRKQAEAAKRANRKQGAGTGR